MTFLDPGAFSDANIVVVPKLDECFAMMASVHDYALLGTLELDLNSLYEKVDTVYCKHSRNSGEC